MKEKRRRGKRSNTPLNIMLVISIIRLVGWPRQRASIARSEHLEPVARAAGVDGEYRVQLLGGLVDRIVERVAVGAPPAGHQDRADHAQLGHRAPQLLRGRRGVQHRQQRHAVEARAGLQEPLGSQLL